MSLLHIKSYGQVTPASAAAAAVRRKAGGKRHSIDLCLCVCAKGSIQSCSNCKVQHVGVCVCVCVCVPRNPFKSAPTARFNNPKVLPLLQTMSSSVQPCRRGCPVGTRLHIDRCRQRTTAPALRTIRTTSRHTLHARVPYRSPHPSPMHPLRLKRGGGRGGAYTGRMAAEK